MSTIPFSRQRRTPLPTDLAKQLPCNLDAERSVLGAILLDNHALVKVAGYLNIDDFFIPQNQNIFSAILDLALEVVSAGQELSTSIDLTTITEKLHKSGTLESSGGAPYVASLVDGMPRVSNVRHYAEIVKEKAGLRNLIHATHNIQMRAFEGADGAAALHDHALQVFSEAGKALTNGHKDKLIAVDVRDFFTMNLSPKEYVIEPILPVRNSGMIYAPTGAGKTYIMLHMAYCVAIGSPSVFVWDVPKERPVVYVEGEMDAQDLQERVQEISRGFDGVFPEKGQLRIIASDMPEQTVTPRINSAEGRKRIEEHLSAGTLLVLDNISALCPTADEDESGEWALVQEWILSLRRLGVAVFLVHHPGKSGSQLGTSKKEFQLSCNLRVTLPPNYDLAEGLRVGVKLDKLRSRGTGEFKPKWAQPFEISLRTEGDKQNRAAVFSHRPMRELLRQRAFEMLQAGMRENDVAQDTGLDRFAIYRIKQKMKSGTPITED